MKRKLVCFCYATIVALTLACTNNDARQRAQNRAEEARRKARQEDARARKELQKLGQEAKREANKVDQNVRQALQSGGPDGERTAAAQRKLDDAGRRVRAAGEQAAFKLDRAAMIARVKTKLA